MHEGLSDLIAFDLRTEQIQPSCFPLPNPEHIQNAASVRLLWQSARLMLREGATPFRSLGRISIRPRKYQFVPLMMALRLDPVRLLIADDVGIGKTIEALLIARELWDRGQIRRLAVLCPPALCDQWHQELTEKFHFPAEILRSSTVSRLERCKPANHTLFEWFPVQVISIDWVKTERNRYSFLRTCPELVIVDEAHGVADSTSSRSAQQQRHLLVKELAEDLSRHLILLTATPHSGINTAFQSLIGLLNPEFAQWEPGQLDEHQHKQLAGISSTAPVGTSKTTGRAPAAFPNGNAWRPPTVSPPPTDNC